MRLKKNLQLRRIGNNNMIVDSALESESAVNYANVYTLNNTAAYIWEAMEGREFTEEDIVSTLCSEFDVEHDIALQDVKAQIEEWSKYKLIEI